jgi:hypothetical protein
MHLFGHAKQCCQLVVGTDALLDQELASIAGLVGSCGDMAFKSVMAAVATWLSSQ